MSESPAPAELAGLVLEACEWLPSGADGGLLRVRGRWSSPASPAPAPPSLWIRGGEHSHRFDSLPDTRFARDPEVWRGTYVVPAALMTEGPDELWLAWDDGARVAVPDFASPPPVAHAAVEAGDDGPGGEVIDRAVLAERRARRAEAEARKQARLAAEALRAVEALELRGTELERRLESLRAERDDLAARLAGPDLAGLREAAAAAARQTARTRGALAVAARVRGGAREWRVHAHTTALVRAGHGDELTALRARLSASESLRDAEAVARAALDEQLDRERAARAAAEQALDAARGSLGARIAELDRHAAGLAGELKLQRRAREQAEAAARIARPEPERAQRLAADLDAAAAALRERVPPPEEPTPDPATPDAASSQAATPGEATPDAATSEEATSEEAAPDESAPEEAAPEEAAPEEAAPEEAARVAAAPHEATPVAATSDKATPVAATSDEATPVAATPDEATPKAAAAEVPERAGHRLRGALVRLAREDPVTAGRILAALLPAQAVILKRAADYDLTIREVGTFAITVAGGRAWVKPVESPRGRRNAEFHVNAGAQALAEILAGAPPRLRRFSGPQRVSGRKRRVKPVLSSLVNSRIPLEEAVRAGAQLDSELVMAALAHVIDPAWTRGHEFTVEQRVGEASWFIVARDAGGLGVTRTPPIGTPQATVRLTPHALQCLLRGEPTPPGDRPAVRGDRLAVALLKAWTDRARGN
jgi:hypothetical protein